MMMRSSNGSAIMNLQQHNASPPMSRCPTLLPSSSDSSTVGIPGNDDDLDSELWHACAGPLVSLPPVNSLVVYWPQGHLEQVANCTPQAVVQPPIPQYNLPPQILCRLTDITLMAHPDTDKLYAQMDLTPVRESEKPLVSEEPPPAAKRKRNSFCKTLTASDTSTHGGFSVPRRAAEECLPELDYTMNPPCQELVANDVHGVEWKFRHIYRGHPRRHLLTTGWSVFVSSKRLVAGDSVLFLRGENEQLRLGVRRAPKQQQDAPSMVVSNQSTQIGVLATAAHAAMEKLRFSVIYHPSTCLSEFVIPYHKYVKAINSTASVGMRFKMRFESADLTERRYAGTITGIGDVDPVRWPNSYWRSLKVEWDESVASERQERVSLWEIEPFNSAAILPPLGLGQNPSQKRRPNKPTLATCQSTPESFHSTKQARVLVHDQGAPKLQEDEEGGTSWRVSGRAVKCEGVLKSPLMAQDRTGREGWLPMQEPKICLGGDISRSLQRCDFTGVLTLQPSQHNVEREQEHLRLCVENYLREHKEHKDSPSPRLSSTGKPLCGSDDIQNSVNSSSVWDPAMKLLWPSNPPHLASMPESEDPSSPAPIWPITIPPVMPDGAASSSHSVGARGESFPSWEDHEGKLVASTPPPARPQCKLFGFALNGDNPPIPTSAKPLKEAEVDVEHLSTGPTNSGDSNSRELAVKTDAVLKHSRFPVRSFIKVHKQGEPGRSVDLTRYESYSELKRALENMFSLHGQLESPDKQWQVVYTDHEGDVLLVGDDPWGEFCSCVRSLKIVSSAMEEGSEDEVQADVQDMSPLMPGPNYVRSGSFKNPDEQVPGS